MNQEVFTTDVPATAQSTALTTRIATPEYGEVDAHEMVTPRVTLLQKMSPVLEEEKDLRDGMIINNITHEVLPTNFIPLMKLPTVYCEFNPRKKTEAGFDPEFAPGALKYKTFDPHDPAIEGKLKFGADGSAPLVKEFMNFLVVFEGSYSPMILSFGKTSFKVGRMFNTMLREFAGRERMFWRKYALASKKEQTDQGETFHTFSVKRAGMCNEQERAEYESIYNQYAALTINTVPEEQ